MATTTQQLQKNYDRAAWFYEKSAKLYSTNQIRESKRQQMKHIRRGDKVLFLGAGSGEDAVMAAREGALVTCIDISQGMLDQVRKKLDMENLDAELVCVNAYDYDRTSEFDVVAANYFLNVFRRGEMRKMLEHTASFVRPGGKYLIADVALPEGGLISRLFNIFYLKLAMAVCWTMGLVPWHENYDYPKFFAGAGLKFKAAEYFRFAKKGPILFQSIVATKS